MAKGHRCWIVVVALAVVAALGACAVDAGLVEQRYNTVEGSRPFQWGDAPNTGPRLFFADLHADPLLALRDIGVDAPMARAPVGHTDILRLRQGGVGLQVFGVPTNKTWCKDNEDCGEHPNMISALAISALWPPETWFDHEALALHQAHRLTNLAADPDNKLVLVRDRPTLDEFCERKLKDPEVIGGLLGLEGAQALTHGAESVGVLRKSGFVLLGLVHFFDNAYGSSQHGRNEHKRGLTDAGEAVIVEAARRGMIIDLAHASKELIRAVIDLRVEGSFPIVVSHTGINPAPDDDACSPARNLEVEDAHLIANTGGLIGPGLWDDALCPIIEEGTAPQAVDDTYARRFADRVDFMIKKEFDARFIALGSDFDGYEQFGFDATGLPLLAPALAERDVPKDAIKGIAGLHVLRFLMDNLPGSAAPSPGPCNHLYDTLARAP